MVQENKYFEAGKLIIKNLEILFGKQTFYLVQKIESLDNSTEHITNMSYHLPDDAGGPRVILAQIWFDLIIPERKERIIKELDANHLISANFGDLVRSIYHEIYIHVKDANGLGGDLHLGKYNNRQSISERTSIAKQNLAVKEFRAYYGEYMNTNMPEGGLKYYYWRQIVYGKNINGGCFTCMSKQQQKFYSGMYQKILDYVQSFK